MKTILELKEGLDSPVTVKVSKNGKRFTVIYGKQIRKGLDYCEATREFGACVFHSLGCLGLLDTEEIGK